MTLLAIILFSIGLSLDGLAVSISCGMSQFKQTHRNLIRFAAILAFFHILMPLVGWLLTSRFHGVIDAYDHWIAFLLLSFLGVKMIYESFSCVNCNDNKKLTTNGPFSLKHSLVYGLATSIDALIAGMAMAMVTIKIITSSSQLVNMIITVSIMGVITFVFALVGLFIGKKSRNSLGKKAELIGGILLVGIGIKILIEHLME